MWLLLLVFSFPSFLPLCSLFSSLLWPCSFFPFVLPLRTLALQCTLQGRPPWPSGRQLRVFSRRVRWRFLSLADDGGGGAGRPSLFYSLIRVFNWPKKIVLICVLLFCFYYCLCMGWYLRARTCTFIFVCMYVFIISVICYYHPWYLPVWALYYSVCLWEKDIYILRLPFLGN